MLWMNRAGHQNCLATFTECPSSRILGHSNQRQTEKRDLSQGILLPNQVRLQQRLHSKPLFKVMSH
jgi:hypothetical protein